MANEDQWLILEDAARRIAVERDSAELAAEQYAAQVAYWTSEADALHALVEKADTLAAAVEALKTGPLQLDRIIAAINASDAYRAARRN